MSPIVMSQYLDSYSHRFHMWDEEAEKLPMYANATYYKERKAAEGRIENLLCSAVHTMSAVQYQVEKEHERLESIIIALKQQHRNELKRKDLCETVPLHLTE